MTFPNPSYSEMGDLMCLVVSKAVYFADICILDLHLKIKACPFFLSLKKKVCVCVGGDWLVAKEGQRRVILE